jgi:hypothetical protein
MRKILEQKNNHGLSDTTSNETQKYEQKKALIIWTYKATSVILVRLPLSLKLYKNFVCVSTGTNVVKQNTYIFWMKPKVGS